MTTLCGPMKEKLSQTTMETSSSWFVFEQRVMKFLDTISNLLLGIPYTLRKLSRTNWFTSLVPGFGVIF